MKLNIIRKLNASIGETIVLKDEVCSNCQRKGNLILIEVYPGLVEKFIVKKNKNGGKWKAVCTNCKKRFNVYVKIAEKMIEKYMK